MKPDLTADVRECFLRQHGRLDRQAVAATFQVLLAECEPRAVAAEKPTGANYIPDLVGTNLERALVDYDWRGYALVGDPAGVWVQSVLPLGADGAPPKGFHWVPGGRFLLAD